MLCDTCRRGLEGMHDPAITPRLRLKDQTPPGDITDAERYVYGHHRTKQSLLDAIDSKCLTCIELPRLHWLLRQPGYRELEDRSDGPDYFSTFEVKVDGDRLLLHVKCEELEEISTLVPVGNPVYDATVVYELEDSTGGRRASRQVEQWVENCTTHHPRCREGQDGAFHPTRLLEINDSCDPPTYRLRLRQECSPSSRYITLSYSWGTRPIEEKQRLLQTTHEELRSERPIAGLPKTFRDTMEVAMRLGVRYVWIDSLCIIQDSRDDWQREAATMQNVYRSAYLTVSATAGIDDQAGLFYKRNAADHTPTVASVRLFKDSEPALFRHRDEGSRYYELFSDDNILKSRGWCLQERLLSPRVVHFCARQLFWECRESAACETVKKIDVRGHHSPALSSQYLVLWKRLLCAPTPPELEDHWDQLLQEWYKVTQMYSRSKVTYPSDKLVGISGLANDMKGALQRVRPGEKHGYFAGLWESDLRTALCWVRSGLIPGKKPSGYRSPSWSWASLDSMTAISPRRPIKGADVHWFVNEQDCTARVEYLGEETGQVSKAQLDITGPFAIIHMENSVSKERYARMVQCIEDPVTGTKFDLPTTPSNQFDPVARFDEDDCMPTRAFGIPIYQVWDTNDGYYIPILLFAQSEKTQDYRRIGRVMLISERREATIELFKTVRKKRITVI